MAERKKIKEVETYGKPWDGWEVTFIDGTKDVISRTAQKGLQNSEAEEKEVEFKQATYLLDKEDVQTLQGLKIQD